MSRDMTGAFRYLGKLLRLRYLLVYFFGVVPFRLEKLTVCHDFYHSEYGMACWFM